MKPSSSEGGPEPPRYEPGDLDPGGVGLVTTMLVLGLIFCSIVAALYYQSLSVHTQRSEGPILPPVPSAMSRQFPAPRLQVQPSGDLAAYRQREEEILSGYAWVDREKGVVRIPIDLAMKLVAERGLPRVGEEPGPTWEEVMQQRVLQDAGKNRGNGERRLP